MIDQMKKDSHEELQPASSASREVKLPKKADLYETDICNAELVMDAHSDDAFKFMRIQKYDAAPMAVEPDDVVVRVEVSVTNRNCSMLS